MQRRVEVFTRFRTANSHPTTELKYSTPFELLIAVVLSAHARNDQFLYDCTHKRIGNS